MLISQIPSRVRRSETLTAIDASIADIMRLGRTLPNFKFKFIVIRIDYINILCRFNRNLFNIIKLEILTAIDVSAVNCR